MCLCACPRGQGNRCATSCQRCWPMASRWSSPPSSLSYKLVYLSASLPFPLCSLWVTLSSMSFIFLFLSRHIFLLSLPPPPSPSSLLLLHQDQVEHLRDLNIPACSINSKLPIAERRLIMADLESESPRLKLLYITPEMVTSPGFKPCLTDRKSVV